MSTIHDKILTRGVSSLSNEELITSIIVGGVKGTECDEEQALLISRSLLCQYNDSLEALTGESLSRLRMCEGIGLRRAMQLQLSSELGRRVISQMSDNYRVITSSVDVISIFRPLLSSLGYEEFWVLFLSSSNSVIERMKVSQGGVNSTVVDNKLIIKRAVELLASKIIVVHNHPSGSAAPSGADITLTEKIRGAAQLFDIEFVDHLIITSGDYYSFASTKR